MFFIRYLLAAVLLLGSFGVVRADTLDRIVAVVNGDVILYSELKERVAEIDKELASRKQGENLLENVPRGEREVLQQMVRERLAEQEAKRLKISVGDSEIDEVLESLKRENNINDAQLEIAVMQQQGITIQQFRTVIKKDLEKSRLIDRVLKSKTVITDAEVDSHMGVSRPASSSSDSSSGQKTARIAIIFLPEEEKDASGLAKELLGKLKKGGDFSALAKEHSKGPSADEGGDIGYVALDELAPEIGDAVKKLGKNGLTDVVKASNGYYIIKVIDVRQGKKAQDDQALSRDRVRKQLFQQEMARKFEEWIKDLEAKSFIQISL
ncbi:MAG: peptidylprolyl isomerase [Acidobacteriota bacterium]